MKTLLFPTDFSENAMNAMHYALAFAAKTNAEIVLLHVSEIPYDFASRADIALDEMRKYAKKEMKKLLNKLQEDEAYAQVEARSILKSGSVIPVILESILDTNADMVIMGTKGASGLNRMLFGSSTAEIIRHADVPVLVVPENAEFHDFEKIIYAIDYREDDIRIMEEMKRMADIFGISIQTIHVAEKASLQEEIMHRGFKELLRERLPGIAFQHDLLINKSFFEAMEQYLSQHTNALLAMTHYKKPFLTSLLSTSISREMTYHTKMPLLIFNLAQS